MVETLRWLHISMDWVTVNKLITTSILNRITMISNGFKTVRLLR